MRGQGVTTKQIKESPSGAIYVWVHDNTRYVEGLAMKNGRGDLRFASPDSIKDIAIGTNRPVIVDHAAELGEDASNFVVFHNAKVLGKENP